MFIIIILIIFLCFGIYGIISNQTIPNENKINLLIISLICLYIYILKNITLDLQYKINVLENKLQETNYNLMDMYESLLMIKYKNNEYPE